MSRLHREEGTARRCQRELFLPCYAVCRNVGSVALVIGELVLLHVHPADPRTRDEPYSRVGGVIRPPIPLRGMVTDQRKAITAGLSKLEHDR